MSRPTGPSWARTVQLRAGVSSAVTEHEQLHLVAWPHQEHLGRSSAARQTLLERLSAGPCPEPELDGGALADGEDGHDRRRFVDRLRRGGWLQTTVMDGDRRLWSVLPLRPPPDARRLSGAARLVLSRFTVLRPAGGDLLVESPRAWAELRLHDPAVLAALGLLTRPPASEEPAEPAQRALLAALGADLRETGFLVPAGEEEDELRLRQWSPHDLWFHARSRAGSRGRPGDGFAGTWWGRGRFDPLPARHDRFPGPIVGLRRPDLDACRATDPTLTAVLEDRRSIRQHDDRHPLTVEQLGEFLYRCARVRATYPLNGLELVDRPYPSGGALGELELYPAVWNVAGIDRGLYHYDAHGHRLERVDADQREVRRITSNAAQAAQLDRRPQLVLVVAARFGRVMWKYEGMGYALILKHVGVLYQVMYLVATAMGLAPCGLGAGDAEAFSEAAGLDYLEESSVGEFLLGSRPPPEPNRERPA